MFRNKTRAIENTNISIALADFLIVTQVLNVNLMTLAEGSPVFSCIRILFKEEKRSCGFLTGRLQHVEENSEELQHATRDDKNVEDAVDVMLLRAD